MHLLLTLAYSLLFIFLIGKMKFFRLPGISVRLLQTGFIIKLIAGIAVGLIYTYYYTDRLTADTFKFFDDSAILFNAIYVNQADYWRMLTGIGASSPELQHYYDTMTNWYDTFSPFNDNRTMIRLNAFLRLFSMGNYYVHVTVVCFLSYAGIVGIIKVFNREYVTLSKGIFIVFLLLPSVLFWGSGLLKDALVFFTFGLVVFNFDRLLHAQKPSGLHLLYFIISFFLLMMTKFQVFLISIPLLAAWGVTHRLRSNPMLTFSIVSGIFILIMFLVSSTSPRLDVINLLVQKQQAFFKLAEESGAGSLIAIPVLENTISSMIINAPVGFLTSLTRPFITDSGAVLNTVSAIENTLILLMVLYCLFNFRKENVRSKILPVFCLFYTLYSFTLIGMITPVLGAIVRYKAQALPFMVVLFIIIAHPAMKKIVDKFIPKSII